MDFTTRIRRRLAETAVGASALRNQGAAGVIEAARSHLRELDLTAFSTPDADVYCLRLDTETVRMVERFPDEAKNWGAARKALNLYLRDALYNHYLAEHFGLSVAEQVMEVPLDKDVATGLRRERPEGGRLPRWPGLKHLTPDISKEYQAAAESVARRGEPWHRVHLDLVYWRPPALDEG